MPEKIVRRKIEALAIHGHIGAGAEDEENLDYEWFFNALKSATPESRQIMIAGELVAIPEITQFDGFLAALFVIGSPTASTMIFDPNTGQASQAQFDSRFLVNGTWVIFDSANRVVVVERARPGVPLNSIERVLESFGRNVLSLDRLTISLTSIASNEFATKLKKFTRIRQASLRLQRPNNSWTATLKGLIGGAGASNAGSVQATFNASRDESLSKTDGVVPEIVEITSKPIHSVRNATFVGNVAGESGEQTISLRRNRATKSFSYEKDSEPFARLEAMKSSTAELFDELWENYDWEK